MILAETNSAGAAVELRHVSKNYGAGPSAAGAVVDLSLRIEPGEICVLVGPSGCGKTTTLRMVNRLVDPSSGQVLVDGQDVATISPTELRRGIGYVIQQIGLFPHYTVAQNVATVPRLLKWPEDRIKARTDELLELVGLDPALVRGRYPAQLSGGERQRVGVARAMAVRPPVMLMDEPFGAVDPIVRERLQDEFLRIQRTQKTTVIFVTHDIDEAVKMGDRVAIMERGGHLAQYASPEEILARPATDFVAQFVGADRGIKRLRLRTVGDAATMVPPIIQGADASSMPLAQASVGESRGPRVPMVDAAGRPLGWAATAIGQPLVAESGTLPEALRFSALRFSALRFSMEMSLHEALSRLLASGEEGAIVVRSDGAYAGVLTLTAISTLLRTAPTGREDNDSRDLTS